MRVHGTTACRPAEVFRAEEAALLLERPSGTYDTPIWSEPKVHRDFHVEVARSLYSVSHTLVGKRLVARADQKTVKLYLAGELLKVHPRLAPGKRSSDPGDFPEGRETYANRDLEHLARLAREAGEATGAYAAAILDHPLPWTKMRQVYRLLGLVKKWGPARVEQACARALEAEAVDVNLVSRMLERAWRAAGVRARAAQLDPTMTLESFDETAQITYDREVLSEFVTLRFVENAHNAFLLGPTGVGKTFLANGIGHAACRRRISVHFERADRLHKRLKAARLDQSYDAELRKLIGVELLIVDDFCLQAMDATETADFYELAVERHHRAATLVTSNRSPDEWLGLMADPLLAQSAVDRLQSAAYELVIEGESYRRRERPSVSPAPSGPSAPRGRRGGRRPS